MGRSREVRSEWAPALFYAITLNFALAALMISAPNQFVGPAYTWMASSLSSYALFMLGSASAGVFAALGLLPPRLVPVVLVGLAAPLLALAVGFARIGLLGGPIFYGTDAAVLTWMAIVLIRGGQPTRPRPLQLSVGIGQLAQGAAMLILPAQYSNAAIFGEFPTYRPIIAVCWIVGGSALLYAQARPDRSVGMFALLATAVNYGLYASFFVPTRAWTGVIGYSSVVPFLLLSIYPEVTWRNSRITVTAMAAVLAIAAGVVLPPPAVLVAAALLLVLIPLALAGQSPALVNVGAPGLGIAFLALATTGQAQNSLVTQVVVGAAVSSWLVAWHRWRWSAHVACAIGSWLLGVSLVGLLVQIIDLRAVTNTSIPLDFGTSVAVLLTSVAIVLAAVPQVQHGPIGGRVFAGLGAVLVLVILRGLIASAGQAAVLKLAQADLPGSGLIASVTDQANNGLLLMIAATLLVTGVVTTRTITAPLQAMVQAMERFGQGDHAVRLAPSGSDEIDRAQRVFNRMASELGRSQADLQAARDALQVLNADLEDRVERRTAELVAATKELEAFSYSVSHDLRAPLRSIDGFSAQLLKRYDGKLDDDGQRYLGLVRESSQEMARLIDDLLRLSMISRSAMRHEQVDLSALTGGIVADLRRTDPGRTVTVSIEPGLMATGDPALIRAALQNLLSNAWKFSGRTPSPRIEVGALPGRTPATFFVRDNGAGFDMTYAQKLFTPFQRLHAQEEFSGTGVGLATVQRIIRRHGGTIRAESAVGHGATFFFTLEPSAAPGEPEPSTADNGQEAMST